MAQLTVWCDLGDGDEASLLPEAIPPPGVAPEGGDSDMLTAPGGGGVRAACRCLGP